MGVLGAGAPAAAPAVAPAVVPKESWGSWVKKGVKKGGVAAGPPAATAPAEGEATFAAAVALLATRVAGDAAAAVGLQSLEAGWRQREAALDNFQAQSQRQADEVMKAAARAQGR
jgi:hypothetical protein